MKTPRELFLFILCISFILSCTKEYKNPQQPPPLTGGYTAPKHHYGSMKDFYKQNSVKAQSFNSDAAIGGTIVTPHGTVITIPANAFVTLNGVPVTGNVSIEYKELYKKSEMLYSDKPTVQYDGHPLKSGGEFFIKATSNGAAVQLTPGSFITVEQPLDGLPFDANMLAFTALTDTFKWVPANNAGVNDSISGNSYTSYIFGLYQFNNPEDSGTWCNSDCSSFFSSYVQTTMTMQPDDNPLLYNTDVFLIFSDIKTMIHVYYSPMDQNYPYLFAPEGLNCTAVAVGVKDSTLYSSFTPIIIGTNQTINFSLSPTTDEDFYQALDALN
jgi:hypothetical protein